MNRLSPGMFCTMNTDTVDQQLSSLFPLDDQQPANDINYLPNHDILNPIESQHYSPHLLLEQQFKLTQLQQLQQLQNQIFQQQIALISGQTSPVLPDPSPDHQRDQPAQFNGLLTPGSSTELRPQQNTDYVSPMTLHYVDTPQNVYRDPLENHNPLSQQQQQPHSQYFPPRGFTSAPANIAFNTNPISLPADVDFDISPLTSPWLGANQQSMTPRHKRAASLSGDESTERPERKRLSPAIRPTNPKKPTRGYKSTTCTPALRVTRSRKGSMAGDTPSPVDLSMPPPAPPANQALSNTSLPSSIPNYNPHLTPVTPASIMNLGKIGLNSRLAPVANDLDMTKAEPKAKGSTRPRAITDAGVRIRPKKMATSPNLKAILPAGSNPHHSSISQPVTQVRKTSHKAAEQKRRDSLKTTFDDLRVLLPPIPLPSDENFPDERILPGALPPRGPPKAGGEGPNKGVSKLQLLMCGNDYIRQLKGRVERRDEEIYRLRREIVRLRQLLGDEAMNAMEDVDLERDLDANEPFGSGFGRGGSIVVDDEGDEDGEE